VTALALLNPGLCHAARRAPSFPVLLLLERLVCPFEAPALHLKTGSPLRTPTEEHVGSTLFAHAADRDLQVDRHGPADCLIPSHWQHAPRDVPLGDKKSVHVGWQHAERPRISSCEGGKGDLVNAVTRLWHHRFSGCGVPARGADARLFPGGHAWKCQHIQVPEGRQRRLRASRPSRRARRPIPPRPQGALPDVRSAMLARVVVAPWAHLWTRPPGHAHTVGALSSTPRTPVQLGLDTSDQPPDNVGCCWVQFIGWPRCMRTKRMNHARKPGVRCACKGTGRICGCAAMRACPPSLWCPSSLGQCAVLPASVMAGATLTMSMCDQVGDRICDKLAPENDFLVEYV
jgi:hypothetical protein